MLLVLKRADENTIEYTIHVVEVHRVYRVGGKLLKVVIRANDIFDH